MDDHEKSRFDADCDLDQALEAAEIVDRENSDLLKALADSMRRTEAAVWAEENGSAIAERRKWIEEKGTTLLDVHVLDGHPGGHRD